MPTATKKTDRVFAHGARRFSLFTGSRAKVIVRRKPGMSWLDEEGPRREKIELRTQTAYLRGERLPQPAGAPVFVLLPGFNCTHLIWEGLARKLHTRGCDVFMVNFRGQGPDDFRSEPRYPVRGAAGFDKIALEDTPAIIEHAYETTGRKVHVVGFSMGGLAVHAYRHGVTLDEYGVIRYDAAQAAARAEILASVTEVGRPAQMEAYQSLTTGYFFRVGQLLSLIPQSLEGVDLFPSALFGPFGSTRRYGRLGRAYEKLLKAQLYPFYKVAPRSMFCRENISFAFFVDMLRTHAIQRTHTDIFADVTRFYRHGWMSADGALDYENAPGKQSFVERLAIVGGDEDTAEPIGLHHSVADIHMAAESARKSAAPGTELVVKIQPNTGHLDAVMGPQEETLLGIFERWTRGWVE